MQKDNSSIDYQEALIKSLRQKFPYLLIGISVLIIIMAAAQSSITRIFPQFMRPSPTPVPMAASTSVTPTPTQSDVFVTSPRNTNTPMPTKAPTAPPATPTPAPRVNGTSTTTKTYVVQSGDYLWEIAEEYYGDGFKAYDIAKANNITDPTYIYKGMKLTLSDVPSKELADSRSGQITDNAASTGPTKGAAKPETYTVKEGDTLWDIAINSYGDGFSWQRIAEANSIANPSLIEAGTVITIPRS